LDEIPKKDTKEISKQIMQGFSAPNLKVGGLKQETIDGIRDLLLVRLLSQTLLKGVDVCRGMVFSGPPGTGKTLLARRIAEITGMELKIINGPEIHGKFLGESEKNIRDIFKDAQIDAEEAERIGVEPKQHLIFFDEIDALLSNRDSYQSSEGRSSVVNQFLSLVDGATKMKNVLIIGTTNRFDSLDPAVTRSGRLEYHVKFELPGRESKAQIARILCNNTPLMANIQEYFITVASTQLPQNITGADIHRLVQMSIVNAIAFQIKENINSTTESFSSSSQEDFFVTKENVNIAKKQLEQSLATISNAQENPLVQ